ncbi:hypothetical protein OIE62_07765 [Streptomyces scopuliridis]|uniref:Uncharacterized protein n=1 Tax=Streptomyces scopuliridis TaxID=452529 RepID=A0ACD4ZWX5_9ACTN|nr:hypothetical protein [Streptomyces scopuliridis]WSC01537.1 hypothetical protein OG835_34055 [Streptomyces scopuliridis]WSC04925.1 hypothetical protein OIE62_07765 [Streptomyces scopuliridis]
MPRTADTPDGPEPAQPDPTLTIAGLTTRHEPADPAVAAHGSTALPSLPPPVTGVRAAPDSEALRQPLPTPTHRSPTIAIRQIDLLGQIDHLRQLGADFAALHTTITALDAQPGTAMLRQLGPKILAIHELVGRTLVRLSVLDGSQYTAVPGSRTSLETLSSVVASASVAASQLAIAVADNPLEAAAFPGGPQADDVTVRRTRHAEAAPRLAESLTTAAHHLDLCATCCQYTASGIARDLKDHPEHTPQLPNLTAAQYAALDKIAQGGAQLYESRGRGISVLAGDGSTIHAEPFAAIDKHRLVHVNTTTSALAGQSVTITAAGKWVLDIQKPGRAPTAAPGTVPAAGKEDGRRR